MPPKRAVKPKLHDLAVELPVKTVVNDPSKRREYIVGRQFATGGFGRIYTCRESGASAELVMKVEPFGNGPLFTEVNVFQRILKPEMIESYKKSNKLKWIGLPWIISSGFFEYKNEKLRFLVMPKYETSLESIRIQHKDKLTESQVWKVTKCMVQSLDYIHSKNYVHADIKAANILLEKSSDFSTSILVDYGLARNVSSNEDKPDKKRAHNGTAIFTSTDAHRGCHPSYRGDIEILAYNIIYWMTGSLPWLAFESTPDKVYNSKMDFLNNLETNCNTLLKKYPRSAAGVVALLSIVKKNGYKDQFKFPELYKVVDKIITSDAQKSPGTTPTRMAVASSSRKRPGTDDDRSTSDKPSAQPSKCGTRLTAGASKTRSNQVKVVAPVTIPSSSTTSVNPPSAARAARAARRLSNDSEPVSKTSTSEPAGKTSTQPGRTRSRQPAVVIPGLKSTVTRSGQVPSEAKENVPVSRSSSLEALEQIDSPTRRSPGKLRQAVPGVRNFPRDRRSIVIQQITRKYKRIATQKTRQQLEELP